MSTLIIPMELEDEIKLVKKAQTDPQSFSELYELNYPRIFNYILKRVMNLEIAQDITSEVFLKAFKNIWQFHFRQLPFSAWLYRIACHEISNYIKKNYYKTVSLDGLLEAKGFEPMFDDSPETELMEAEEIQQKNQEFFEIQLIMRELPLKFQTVISLKFFEKKSLKEVGQILGKKEGTIKSSLSRGLEKLRILLEREKIKKELLAKSKVKSNEALF